MERTSLSSSAVAMNGNTYFSKAIVPFAEDLCRGFLPGVLLLGLVFGTLTSTTISVNGLVTLLFGGGDLSFDEAQQNSLVVDASHRNPSSQTSVLHSVRDLLDCDLSALACSIFVGTVVWFTYWVLIFCATAVCESDLRALRSLRRRWSVVENGTLTRLVQRMEATTDQDTSKSSTPSRPTRKFYLPTRKEQLSGPSFRACFANVLFNTTLHGLCIGMALFWCCPRNSQAIGSRRRFYLPQPAPIVTEVVPQLLVVTILWDVSVYAIHRFVLHGWLPAIHELHHRVKGALPISCMYMHPLDNILEFVIPDVVWLCVLRANWLTWLIWLTCVAWDNVLSHSGLKLDFCVSGGINHWLHHAKYNCNFGAYLLDPWFGTSAKASPVIVRSASLTTTSGEQHEGCAVGIARRSVDVVR